jgi:hypothetical protein
MERKYPSNFYSLHHAVVHTVRNMRECTVIFAHKKFLLLRFLDKLSNMAIIFVWNRVQYFDNLTYEIKSPMLAGGGDVTYF